MKSCRYVAITLCAFLANPACAQFIQPARPFSTAGKIKSIKDGVIAITDRTGKSYQLRYSNRSDGRIKLARGQMFQAVKADIQITGSLSIAAAEKGFPVRIDSHINDNGRLGAPVQEVFWAEKRGFEPGLTVNRKKKDKRGIPACVIKGPCRRTATWSTDAEAAQITLRRQGQNVHSADKGCNT